jgi:hypothetical protein
MTPDPLAMKFILHRREAELQKLIRQMREDKLHSSPVYKNLEHELETVQNRLTDQEKKQ